MKGKNQISHYQKLKKKWLARHRKIERKIIAKHGHLISSLVPKHQLISGIMLATIPFIQMAPASVQAQLNNNHSQGQKHLSVADFLAGLKAILPEEVRPLIPQEEDKIAAYLSGTFHISVLPELNGIKLNRSYGLIGKEQHLRRYPGDSINQHFDNPGDAALFGPDGTAPGLGAWGYFTDSKGQITEEGKLREKYYIAVPTFLAPGFNQNVGKFGLFFKYRKMLVVNPENGKAIIADIADAGPAEWTGKNLGGSPEVMHYLERVDGAQRGPVLYFFVNDPNDTIPLGPITL